MHPRQGKSASHPHPTLAAGPPSRRACRRHHMWGHRGCRGRGGALRGTPAGRRRWGQREGSHYVVDMVLGDMIIQ